MPDEDDISAILSFGLIRPRISQQRAVETLARFGVLRATELLARHKVARISKCRLQAQVGSTGIENDARELLASVAAGLAAHLEPIDGRMATTEEVLRLVRDRCRGVGVSTWLMKGFSIRKWYPAELPRDVGDLDLLVADVDAAWRIADVLLANGYTYPAGELPWVKGDVGGGGLYGQVRLVTPARDALSVDVHAGPYSVRHCARMPLRALESGPAELEPVATTDDVCCVLGNAAGDCFVDAKTINDLVLALDRELDVAGLHSSLDAAGLLPFLATCLERVEQLCELDEPRRAALAALRPPVVAEEPPPLERPDSDHRVRITVQHAARVAARLPGATSMLVDQVVASARRAYGEELPLRLDQPPVGTGDRLPELVNWNCVRLVPVFLLVPLLAAAGEDVRGRAAPTPAVECRRLSERLSVQRTAAGELIDTGAGCFVPTVDFGIPIDLARELVLRAG